MKPELWTVPIIDYPLKSFGFMLMVGFISAAYLAARRAQKVRANPDLVLNCSIVALVGSVVGARLFYVVHYWQREFAGQPNPLLGALNFTSGGMEQLGGIAGAMILIVAYLLYKRESIRLYFDILTPSLMWGLAFGRIGCFLNGCCWGGVCAGTVAEHWGVHFPYGSGAHVWQYRNRLVEVPAELLSAANRPGILLPLPRELVFLEPVRRLRYGRRLAAAQQSYDALLRLEPDSDRVHQAKRALESADKLAKRESEEHQPLNKNLRTYLSSRFPGQQLTPSELADLAARDSLAVHPVQLYSSINALVGCLFLSWVFRVRQRHGMVFVVWLLTYPVTRLVEEQIRVDNPHDTLGMSISSVLSLAMIATGIVLAVWFRRLPLRSALAKPWTPPEESPAPAAADGVTVRPDTT